MFIKYIFRGDASKAPLVRTNEARCVKISNSLAAVRPQNFDGPSRIIHKDHELVAAFCVNKVNSNCIALASAKDLVEIDLSDMLASDCWSWTDDSSSSGEKTSKEEDFLVISVPSRQTRMSQQGLFAPITSNPWHAVQTGQGANMLLKRSLSGIRKMESHPTLPYYVTGGVDGAIYMWEWGHQQQISQFQPPGHTSKVCNIHFSSLGNKVCSADGDGYVSLWQVSLSQNPFFKHLAHDRGANDLCFLSSSSVIATTGLSSTSRNVAVWDILLPRKSVLVKGRSK